jgi:hypothetical protein
VTWKEAHESLRRGLRDETSAAIDPAVQDLYDSMVDYRTSMEKAMQEDRERRRREREGS